MPEYHVSIEASGYGDPVDDGERFLAAVAELTYEPEPRCAQDEKRGMLMVTFELEAANALDAHDDAFGVWAAVWSDAFPDLSPPVALAVTARPTDAPHLLASRAEVAALEQS